MSTQDDLQPYKNSIIKEMFLHTADENYITARWCWRNRLMTDFFWNSVHALEKYMKAVLLYNGRPVHKFSHNLAELYDAVSEIAGPLLPAQLTQPQGYSGYWVEFTPREFLEKLDQNGNADNRYLTYGYAQHAFYLPMVDTMVWQVRRLIIPLDQPVVHSRDGSAKPSNREILERQPDYAFNLMEALEKTMAADGSEAQHALLNGNLAFAPPNYPHEPFFEGMSARNPVLLRRVLDPLGSTREENARHGYRMAEWLLANTRQSGPVKREIEGAMQSALAAHPGMAASLGAIGPAPQPPVGPNASQPSRTAPSRKLGLLPLLLGAVALPILIFGRR
ncbi:MAG: hypothetical protein JJ901_03300 [Erythrobacter sp.]|uniref:hypothetical protein n=1 Tax=Erythrobacter sp. TaxID=1042 RepID=UPI001B1907E5|nr:hypothetical protein [Erythrobacter sp.]MBO6767315.1 hypothetical protein [Erythrobacter sp.]